MENKRFLEPFLLEELEIILRKKEQILQELNGQLRGMRGGSLHVKHRNGRVYYCEYAGGKEIGISKDEDKIYRLARKRISSESDPPDFGRVRDPENYDPEGAEVRSQDDQQSDRRGIRRY